MTKRLRRALALSAVGFIVVALPGSVRAQEHAHDGASGEVHPVLRLAFESPQLALAHYGYLGLSREQLAKLREAQADLCAALAERVKESNRAQDDFVRDALHGAHLDESVAASVFRRLAEAEVKWAEAVVKARQATVAAMTPDQQALFVDLASHWLREFDVMTNETLSAGHAGHGSRQQPIRVPGMSIEQLVLAPYCPQVHGSQFMVNPFH